MTTPYWLQDAIFYQIFPDRFANGNPSNDPANVQKWGATPTNWHFQGGDLLRPQPVFAGGSLRGYRVYPGRNRAQFAALGLQPGDLVMAVNGAALDDPNRGLEILRGVGQGSAVTLSVERGGQQQQITIDPVTAIQELQAPAAEAPAEEEDVEEVEPAEDEDDELATE